MLTVNELEVMLLHVAESKYAWEHLGVRLRPYSGWYQERACIDVRGMGRLNATCGTTCTSRAPTFAQFGVRGAVRRATALTRHRVQTKWAGHIKYATRPSEVRLKVTHSCAHGSNYGGTTQHSGGRFSKRQLW